MIFLGADVGTTRIKALAYCDEQRRVLATAAAATPVRSTADGAVHDPAAVQEQVLRCLEDVVAQLQDSAGVAAVCVASLGEEVVLVDEHGDPLGPTPTWYDSPGRGYAATHPDRLNPTYSLFTLRWFTERLSERSAAATRFTDLGSFVTGRLAGLGADLVMDQSHASRTGFFDVRTRRFDHAALAWAGGWEGKLPRLVPSGTLLGPLSGAVAERLGLRGSVAVVTGAHDHFAAAFASGVRQPGDAMLSAGTSEALLVLTAQVPDDSPSAVDIGAFVDDRTWYLHRNVLAGHLFARWQELLGLSGGQTDSWFEPAGWDPPGPSPLCVVEPETGSATLARLPLNVSADDVMRALGEGLAVNCRAMLAQLEEASGGPIRAVTVAAPGGGDAAWLRMRAALLGSALRVVHTAEPTALGAALLAQSGVRGQADAPVATSDIFPPDDDAPRRYYQRLLDAYREATRAPLAHFPLGKDNL